MEHNNFTSDTTVLFDSNYFCNIKQLIINNITSRKTKYSMLNQESITDIISLAVIDFWLY